MRSDHKCSLDADDRWEAEQRVDAIWYEATYRAKQGHTAMAHTFDSVAAAYIAQILGEVKWRERRANQGKSEPDVIHCYLVGYFGDKLIDAVPETDPERYAGWRGTYWTEGRSRRRYRALACWPPERVSFCAECFGYSRPRICSNLSPG